MHLDNKTYVTYWGFGGIFYICYGVYCTLIGWLHVIQVEAVVSINWVNESYLKGT